MIAKEVKYAVEHPEAGAGRRARCFGNGLVGFYRFLLGWGKANGEAASGIGIFYGIRRLSPPFAAWRWGAASSESGFVSKGGRKLPNGCKIGAETCKSSAFARDCPPFCGRDAFANPTLDRRRTEPARMVHLAHIGSHQLGCPPPPWRGGRRVQDSKLGIGAELFLRARAGGASGQCPRVFAFSLAPRGTSGERAGERGGCFVGQHASVCGLRHLSPALSPTSWRRGSLVAETFGGSVKMRPEVGNG